MAVKSFSLYRPKSLHVLGWSRPADGWQRHAARLWRALAMRTYAEEPAVSAVLALSVP